MKILGCGLGQLLYQALGDEEDSASDSGYSESWADSLSTVSRAGSLLASRSEAGGSEAPSSRPSSRAAEYSSQRWGGGNGASKVEWRRGPPPAPFGMQQQGGNNTASSFFQDYGRYGNNATSYSAAGRANPTGTSGPSRWDGSSRSARADYATGGSKAAQQLQPSAVERS